MSEIRTPWGSISTQVSLFPIYYLIFIYGFVYILPFGKDLEIVRALNMSL